MEKPDGFDEYKAKHPDFFMGSGGNLEKEYKVFSLIAHTRKMEDNNAYMTVVARDCDKVIERNMRDLGIEARTLYNQGKFIEECKKEFSKQWYNDTYMLEFILLMGAALRVRNAHEGMHLHISGDTQSGKSAGAKTALKFLAKEATMTKTFTPKAIFYAEGILHERMVVLCDDTTQGPEVAEVYRNILTSWDSGVERMTVNQGKGVELKVPKRVSLIMTNVESVAQVSDDGQDESRYLTIEVRHTNDEMERIWKFVQLEAQPFDKGRMTLLHMVWDEMPLDVDIALHKEFPFKGTMRETKRFATMVQAHALLCGRQTTSDADITAVENLLSYSKKMISSSIAPLTRNEEALRATLTPEWEPCPDVAARLKITRDKLYVAIRGKNGSFENPTGGLLKKEARFEAKQASNPDESNVRYIRLRG